VPNVQGGTELPDLPSTRLCGLQCGSGGIGSRKGSGPGPALLRGRVDAMDAPRDPRRDGVFVLIYTIRAMSTLKTAEVDVSRCCRIVTADGAVRAQGVVDVRGMFPR
jgi:hypothetical protein